MKFDDIKDKIKDLQLVGKGWRGIVYKGIYNGKKVAFKVASKKEFIPNIKKESKVLKIVNKEGIGGKIVLEGDDFIAYEFIEGEPLIKVINRNNGKVIISQLLKQARILDKLGINKEEFHRPYKNVLIDKNLKVHLIDFERAKQGKNIQNVNQLIQFILTKGHEYLPEFNREKLIELAKKYKKEKTDENFRKILDFLGIKD
ncbi:putative serine/threonine protein kinase [Persephonella hydrogeniphila]|uniref:Putative serine/threonine protein kinase n=1 Tax=Persephonella hydrogeniphila TaxID=198703 RepID=A0A285N2U4_9AQUI|nr:serine/threonine protein kinase [Persephonella hydrogeniphila]SNZ03638.1 putative serine/threonine protein kinase [Persephonella hydrogeniphila]